MSISSSFHFFPPNLNYSYCRSSCRQHISVLLLNRIDVLGPFIFFSIYFISFIFFSFLLSSKPVFFLSLCFAFILNLSNAITSFSIYYLIPSYLFDSFYAFPESSISSFVILFCLISSSPLPIPLITSPQTLFHLMSSSLISYHMISFLPHLISSSLISYHVIYYLPHLI